jgi:hypothetical protein
MLMTATDLRIKTLATTNNNPNGKKNPVNRLRAQLIEMLNSHFIPDPNR